MRTFSIGDKVTYIGNGRTHWLDSRTGTVRAINGDGYYEVEMGRLGLLWLVHAANLRSR